MNSYAFDVFPVRPSPQPLEALSSYLSRLAAANGIASCSGFLRWVFPNYTRYAHNITDFPLKRWDALPQVSALSLEALQSMTFYYVNQHFGLSEETQTRHPLRGCLSPHLRYCPLCLSEKGYASLLWRITVLTGCVQHRIHFQEGCPHCGEAIPLLRLRAFGHCPRCDGDLCDVAPVLLTPDELDANIIRTADLTALLQPPKTTGMLWQTRRESTGISIGDMARALGVTRKRLLVFEWGRTSLPLTLALRYCDQLGICLRDVVAPDTILDIEQAMIARITQISREQMACEATRTERDLLSQLQQIAEQLMQEGQSVTVTALSQRSRVDTSDLNNYPTVRNWIEQIRQQRYAQRATLREEELLAIFERVTAPIWICDTPFRVGDVCDEVGMSSSNLRKYPAIEPLVEALVTEAKRRRQSRPLAFLKELEDTIMRLEAQGVTVTLQALQQAGLSLVQLKRYAMTRRRLASVPDIPEHTQPTAMSNEAASTLKQQAIARREQDLRERVHMVLAKYGQLPVRLSLKKVADVSGVSQSMIRSRPDLLKEVHDVIARTPHYPVYSTGEIEALVWKTCDLLLAHEAPLTRTAIYQHLEWSPSYLQAVPLVDVTTRRTLKSYVAYQQQQNQNALLRRVEVYLQTYPENISYAAVARTLACRPEHLAGDVRIRELIDDARYQKESRRSQQLWEQVQTTVLLWQAQDIPVTQKALIEHLGVSVDELNRHDAVRALLENIWADREQQWQAYLEDLTAQAQQYVQQRQADGLPVTQELIASHLGVNTGKLDSYPGTRAIFDALNMLKTSKKQERECKLLTQVEGAIEALQVANLPVHQKAVAAYLGRSPKGLKYYPLVRERLQEVIQANQNS